MNNRRRMMMAAQGGGVLPAGYTECEYLESTGTQWIDTGYYPIASDVVEVTHCLTKIEERFQAVFGTTNAYGSFANVFNKKPSSYIRGTRWSTGYNSKIVNANAYCQNFNLLKKLHYVLGNGYATNTTGSIEKIGDVLNEITFLLPIYLFSASGSYTEEYASNIRVYDFLIKTKNDELILNFIPALDTDGKPCMYDTISKQPFYNSGAGEFLYKLK